MAPKHPVAELNLISSAEVLASLATPLNNKSVLASKYAAVSNLNVCL